MIRRPLITIELLSKRFTKLADCLSLFTLRSV
jgi:hypothetical protein